MTLIWTLPKNMHCKCVAQLYLNELISHQSSHSHYWLLYSIFFFDSSKRSMHDQHGNANQIYKWLNYEWKRHNVNRPFSCDSMPLVSPKSEYCLSFLLHNINSSWTFISSVNIISYSSSMPKEWIRLWCLCLQVCRSVRDEAPALHLA